MVRMNNFRFARDKYHNILFVTGHSGSGKTTFVDFLAKSYGEYMNVIHLDAYCCENSGDEDDKEFTEYLKTNKRSVRTADIFYDFSEKQFEKGKAVVVEGFQLLYLQDWEIRKETPMVILTDNAVTSFIRSYKKNKDDMKLSELGTYILWYWDMSKRIRKMKKFVERTERENDNKRVSGTGFTDGITD